MSSGFFYYDLETSGFNPKEARIMQFAGQRTDLQLRTIGEPHNYLIKLGDDVLPDPDAVLVTGITPQMTIADGMSEAEFLKIFSTDIATPDTIFVGYNTVRFDDEFIRYILYRNFYDPYEWQWQDGRSRWDILDVVRMTRALRPKGIKWPFDTNGNPTNRLELITSLNGLDHANAHDALSDVNATIAVARLIRKHQPKLFDFLLGMRTKKSVMDLVSAGKPFVYTSGKYPSEFEKTTVVGVLGDHPQGQGALVFDLRHDPEQFVDFDASELAAAMSRRNDEPGPRLPVKSLKYNRCPAVAPLGVLDEECHKRLSLDASIYMNNYTKLQKVQKKLAKGVGSALQLLDKDFQTRLLESPQDVDGKLYDGFFDSADKAQMGRVRNVSFEEIDKLSVEFHDPRLSELLPLYKARNFYKYMNDADRAFWEEFRERKLLGGGETSRAAKYFARLAELVKKPDLTGEQQYILEELQLYGQSVLPAKPD